MLPLTRLPNEPSVHAGKRSPSFALRTILQAATLSACLSIAGCSVRYQDKEGSVHLWGFGHLKMRAAPTAIGGSNDTHATVAYITGVRSLGLNLSTGSEDFGIGAGWDSRSRVIIKQDSAEFAVMWPTNVLWLPRDVKDFFNIAVTNKCPPAVLHQRDELKTQPSAPP